MIRSTSTITKLRFSELGAQPFIHIYIYTSSSLRPKTQGANASKDEEAHSSGQAAPRIATVPNRNMFRKIKKNAFLADVQKLVPIKAIWM